MPKDLLDGSISGVQYHQPGWRAAFSSMENGTITASLKTPCTNGHGYHFQPYAPNPATQPPAICSSEDFTSPSSVGIYFQGIEGVISFSVIPPPQPLPSSRKASSISARDEYTCP